MFFPRLSTNTGTNHIQKIIKALILTKTDTVYDFFISSPETFIWLKHISTCLNLNVYYMTILGDVLHAYAIQGIL